MKKILLFVAIFSFPAVFVSAQNTSPYWSLAGNNNATASSKLGTTNDISLRFYTNDIKRMIINSAAGYVGIGIPLPVNILTVKSSGGTPAASWLNGLNSPVFMGFAEGVSSEFVVAAANSNAGRRAVIQGRRSRGTLASPAAVVDNDYLASFLASGYDGSTFQNPASIDFYVDTVPSSGHVPARISFVTGTNIDDRVERLRVGNTGNFNFNGDQLFLRQSDGYVGIGITAPSNKLHVVGRGRFTAGLSVDDGGIYTSYSAGNGIESYGNTSVGSGVYGSGYRGVFGSGSAYGVYGKSYNSGYGVYGSSSSGYSSNGSTGVYGSAYYGVKGDGTYGVYGTGSFAGIYGTGVYGVYGYGTYGVYGASNNNSGYAGYFSGTVYSSGGFVTSDRNLKKNINDFTSALDIINKLQPKQYEFRQDGNFKLMNLPAGKHYGLIAQDLEEVLPGLVKETKFDTRMAQPGENVKAGTSSAPAKPEPSEIINFKAANYTELIPIMIKAMQELEATNKTQQAQIAALTELVNKLSLNANPGSIKLTGVSLENPIPNPANKSTRINYTIPTDFTKAELVISNVAGQKIKQLWLNQSGLIDIDTSKLSAGTYSYTLIVDGAPVSTKKMVITR